MHIGPDPRFLRGSGPSSLKRLQALLFDATRRRFHQGIRHKTIGIIRIRDTLPLFALIHIGAPLSRMNAPSLTSDMTLPSGLAASVATPLMLPLGRDAQGLSPTQRSGVTLAIVAAHLVGVYALMQVREVRETMREAVPLFVDWIAPPTPEPPKPEPPKPAAQPIPRRAPVTNLVTAAPSPAPATFTAPPAEPPVPLPAPVAIAAPPAPPAAAPPPAPKMIPASAVEYLERPEVIYPRQSIRNHEVGTVVVRVLIDTAGLPRTVEVNASSGFQRLDDAAMAATRKARFKPYTENGRPAEGWALIPFPFELEK